MIRNKNLLSGIFKILLAVSAGIILFSSTALMTYIFLSEVSAPIWQRNPLPKWFNSAYRDIFPRAYVIQSGSMEPAIKTGSIVITLPSGSYAQGDVITFAQNGNFKKLITHRIFIREYPDGVNGQPKYTTGGDANEEFDNWEVKNEHIIGKVIFTVPYAGYISDFAKKPQGFILLVIVPATIVIYEEIKNLFKEILKNVKKHRGVNLRHLRSGIEATSQGLPRKVALIPIISVLVFMITFSLGYFTDIEESIGNILGAAESFSENPTTSGLPSPSSTPTSIPVFTPTPTPTGPTTASQSGILKIELQPKLSLK